MKKDVFEELTVVKRSGQRVNFNNYKIAVAIKHAFDSVYGTYDEKNVNKLYEEVLSYIEKNYIDRKTINVEDIQDIIEQKLKEKKFHEVYTSFSEYRKKRAASRQVFTIKQEHKFAKAMEKIADDNLLKSDNNLLPIEILKKYGKTVVNEFAKSYIIDNKYLRAHEEGNIFIHDIKSFPLGMISHTHLILESFIETEESINNLTNFIIDAKDEVSGEINIPSIDKLLNDWVIKKVKMCFQDYLLNYLKVTGFISYINTKKIIDLINKENDLSFNINAYEPYILSPQVKSIFISAYEDSLNKIELLITRKLKKLMLTLENNIKDNQSFSISFGTNENKVWVIINEIIIKLLSELEPLRNVTFIFKVKSKEEKFIDSIAQLILNGKNILIVNEQASYNRDVNEVEYFSNGVRIFENHNDDERSSNGRSVIASTSINLARLGLKYETSSKKDFYEKLDEILETTKNELLLAFETVGNKSKSNYRILFNGNILTDEKLENGQKIRKVIKNGILNIGLVGLKECVSVLAKDKEKEYKLVTEIIKHINEKCEEFSSETKLNFFITEPYKSLAKKEFMALDKAIYGIRKGITENYEYDLITNLSSIKDDYDKLGQLQKLIPGGNMIEISLDKNTTPKKLMSIINEILKSDIGIVKFVSKGQNTCK